MNDGTVWYMCGYYITWAIFLVLGAAGWVMNIMAIVAWLPDGNPSTLEVIVRIVGVPFFILGAIAGWFA